MNLVSAVVIAASGTLANDAYGMLDRNAETYVWHDAFLADFDVHFAADGDIHVADRETIRWEGLSEAELCAYIVRVDPFQRA